MKERSLFCFVLILIHVLFDEFMWFNMSLIWRQEEEITWEKQGMTEIFGPAGIRDGDSSGPEYKDSSELVKGTWTNLV